MKTKPNIETPAETSAVSGSAQPRKLLLGKRVLRHFGVRSAIQTGAGATTTDETGGIETLHSIRQRCR